MLNGGGRLSHSENRLELAVTSQQGRAIRMMTTPGNQVPGELGQLYVLTEEGEPG